MKINRHVSSYVALPLDPHARTARRTRRRPPLFANLSQSAYTHSHSPTRPPRPLTPTQSTTTPTQVRGTRRTCCRHCVSNRRPWLRRDVVREACCYRRRVDWRALPVGLLLSKKSRLESSPSGIALPSDMTSFCVCVLSHWVHAATGKGPDMPVLKCSSHAYLGLYIWHLAICRPTDLTSCPRPCCAVSVRDSREYLERAATHSTFQVSPPTFTCYLYCAQMYEKKTIKKTFKKWRQCLQYCECGTGLLPTMLSNPH
jgi:hypothetical protein